MYASFIPLFTIMTGYYDVVLGLIPLAMAGITGGLVLAGFALTTAIPLGSIAAVGLIGHAMFVNAPVSTEPVQSEPVRSTD